MKSKPLFAALIAQVLLAAGLAYLVWGLEVWLGVSVVQPTYTIVVLVSLGILLIPFAFVRKNAVAVIPAIALIGFLAMPFVTTSALKPMLLGAKELDPKMDRDEIVQTINSRYSSTEFQEPIVFREDESVILFKPQGRDSSLSAESLIVRLDDGRFKSWHFSPD